MGITAALAFLAWLLVLFYFDPNTSGLTGVVLFFVTLAPALLAGIVLGLYALRRRKFQMEPMSALIISGRQGTILGIILVALLIFQVTNFLAWWNVGVLIVVGVFIEFYSRVKVE
jgi:peptidoglycan/LPS O-acetylase OafA/YrhL